MNTPLVSIIIPSYNRAHLIGETLHSVLAQTYTNWECIIVDDGSTDNTAEVVGEYLKKDSRFKYYNRPIVLPKGANSCRNYGYGLSTGEYVNWFDSDDIMFNQYIEAKINKFDEKIKLVISVGCTDYYNRDCNSNSKLIKSENLFKDYLLWKFKILTPSPMFSREFLKNKKLFNVEIKRGQETEFFSRLFFGLDSCSYVIIDTHLMFYRQHEKTISSNDKMYNPSHKTSQLFVFIENLKKSVALNDSDLISHIYNQLINLFFDVLRNRDRKLLIKVRKTIFQTIKEQKIINAYIFYFLSGFLMHTNIESIIIKKQLKKIF